VDREFDTTWDGLPVSGEKPSGSCVVVWRHGAREREFLLLHRRHAGGPGYEGDWAWTPPSGARLPGEGLLDAARRELVEETGLDIPFEPVAVERADWAVFAAEAPAGAVITLDDEHDRYAWMPAAEAVQRCMPARVGGSIAAVDTRLDRRAPDAV
jgi:8-oxo-dGTP pyrophosphatase MutT (NUDIX family)